MSRVGGRGYPPPDAYDDRPPARRRGGRDHQEVDVDIRETEYRRPPPDYLREDHARNNNAGPMVLRERRSEADFDRNDRDASSAGRSRGPPPRREEIEIDIREQDYSRAPPRRRRQAEREEVDVEIRETSRQPPPPPREPDREINFRRGEGARRPRPRETEREEIIIRTGSDSPPPPRARERSRSRVDIDIRERESRGPPPPRSRSRAPEKEEIDIRLRRDDGERTGNRDTLTVREKSRERRRSMPPPRPIVREREEFVYRRPSSPSPPPARQTEEIIIRRRSPSPSPSPPRAPSPPPVETRPRIIQEVITHHRTIDHGVVRVAPSPSPSPSPPPRTKRRDDLEIDIRRKDSRGNVTEEDIRITEDSSRDNRRDRNEERRITRRRSMESAPARRSTREETNINVNIDADFGNADRRVAVPVKPKPREMWTEVTKDLVSREAIIAVGYPFDETEDFFYIMDNLRYLVEVTDDLRYGRRERIDQIQWERQDPRLARDTRTPPRRALPPAPDRGHNGWDEITYERDVTYEERPRRGGFR